MPDPDTRHPYDTITPHIGVDDPAAALEFYARAFGAEELVRLTTPDGGVAHAEMLVGGATVTIGRAIPAYDLVQPAPDQPVHVAITWFGDDVDAAFARAVEAGAEVSSPPADQFHGDRTAVVRDPFGHRWVLATQLEVVPYAEQQRRLDEMMSQASGSS